MTRLGIIGSGAGSNMWAIHRAIEGGFLDAEITLVLSDQPNAGIVEKARSAGLPHSIIDCFPFKQKFPTEAQQRAVKLLKEYNVDLVCLAGFMRIVGQPLLDAFPGKILNIHPSLLPAYPGLFAWEQAVTDGATVSGCTVHYVDSGIDTGGIILQSEVPVLPDDTAATLHQRIQIAEHAAYPEAIRVVSSADSPMG